LKSVLVVNYSQTGQLSDIAELVGPLRAAGHHVHFETLVPESPSPFHGRLLIFSTPAGVRATGRAALRPLSLRRY
jgi:hypothetical protein